MNKPPSPLWTAPLQQLYDAALEAGITLQEAMDSDLPLPDHERTELHARIRTEVERHICLSILKLADVQHEIMRQTEDYDVLDAYTMERGHSQLGRETDFYSRARTVDSDLDSKEVEELRDIQRHWQIELTPWRTTPIWLDYRINNELVFVGSERRVFSGMSGKYRVMVFGRCEQKTDEFGLTSLRFTTEDVRTPVAAPVIPAYSVPGTYVIRVLACKFAMEAKYWPLIEEELRGAPLPVASPDDHESVQDLMNREVARSYVDLYGRDRRALREAVLADIELQAMLFCRGQLVHHRHLGTDQVALITAIETKIDPACGNVAALTEVSVESGGPLFAFKEMAETDPAKARLHLLMFLSDMFYTGNERLMERSELLLCMMVPAINRDNLDAGRYEHALSWLLGYVEDEFTPFLAELSKRIRTAKHLNPDTGGEIDHDLIESHVAAHVAGDMEDNDRKENSFTLNVATWQTRLLLVRKMAEDDFAEMMGRIHQFKQQTNRAVVRELFPIWSGDTDRLTSLLTDHVLRRFVQRMSQ